MDSKTIPQDSNNVTVQAPKAKRGRPRKKSLPAVQTSLTMTKNINTPAVENKPLLMTKELDSQGQKSPETSSSTDTTRKRKAFNSELKAPEKTKKAKIIKRSPSYAKNKDTGKKCKWGSAKKKEPRQAKSISPDILIEQPVSIKETVPKKKSVPTKKTSIKELLSSESKQTKNTVQEKKLTMSTEVPLVTNSKQPNSTEPPLQNRPKEVVKGQSPLDPTNTTETVAEMKETTSLPITDPLRTSPSKTIPHNSVQTSKPVRKRGRPRKHPPVTNVEPTLQNQNYTETVQKQSFNNQQDKPEVVVELKETISSLTTDKKSPSFPKTVEVSKSSRKPGRPRKHPSSKKCKLVTDTEQPNSTKPAVQDHTEEVTDLIVQKHTLEVTIQEHTEEVVEGQFPLKQTNSTELFELNETIPCFIDDLRSLSASKTIQPTRPQEKCHPRKSSPGRKGVLSRKRRPLEIYSKVDSTDLFSDNFTKDYIPDKRSRTSIPPLFISSRTRSRLSIAQPSQNDSIFPPVQVDESSHSMIRPPQDDDSHPFNVQSTQENEPSLSHLSPTHEDKSPPKKKPQKLKSKKKLRVTIPKQKKKKTPLSVESNSIPNTNLTKEKEIRETVSPPTNDKKHLPKTVEVSKSSRKRGRPRKYPPSKKPMLMTDSEQSKSTKPAQVVKEQSPLEQANTTETSVQKHFDKSSPASKGKITEPNTTKQKHKENSPANESISSIEATNKDKKIEVPIVDSAQIVERRVPLQLSVERSASPVIPLQNTTKDAIVISKMAGKKQTEHQNGTQQKISSSTAVEDKHTQKEAAQPQVSDNDVSTKNVTAKESFVKNSLAISSEVDQIEPSLSLATETHVSTKDVPTKESSVEKSPVEPPASESSKGATVLKDQPIQPLKTKDTAVKQTKNKQSKTVQQSKTAKEQKLFKEPKRKLKSLNARSKAIEAEALQSLPKSSFGYSLLMNSSALTAFNRRKTIGSNKSKQSMKSAASSFQLSIVDDQVTVRVCESVYSTVAVCMCEGVLYSSYV